MSRREPAARMVQLQEHRQQQPMVAATGNSLFSRQLAVFQALAEEKAIITLPWVQPPQEQEGAMR